jgi:hypothetical protein
MVTHSVTSSKEVLAKKLNASYIIDNLCQHGMNTVSYVAYYAEANEGNILKK